MHPIKIIAISFLINIISIKNIHVTTETIQKLQKHKLLHPHF